MDISAILFALAILHAGYLIQLCFRQPSSKKVCTPSENRIMWFAVSPDNMVIVRFGTICLCIHHALVSLILSQTTSDGSTQMLVQQVCAVPDYLDRGLFAWSSRNVGPLVLLYAGSYVRLQAYAQLGTDFTYRLAKPAELVTDGLYAYVRHPSYSGLLGVLIALYALFLDQHGLVSCWLPLFSQQLVTDAKFAYIVPLMAFSMVIWLVMVKRVQEEELMMEREFGQRWREYCMTTKKYIPFIL